ncbi:MAG: hypothetical protein R3330_08925 [Saprospiraceae bacterium]|nr:hypothetical protein [Saprospiraceae bacterium]
MLACAPGQLAAKGISINAVGSIDLGGGSLDLGCGDLVNNGQLSLGSATLNELRHVSNAGVINGQSGQVNLSGDWSNSGTVNAGSSFVGMSDGCGTTASTVSGDTTFYDWSVTTVTGKQLNFTSGNQQDVLNDLVFNGSPGGMLTIRSTVPDSPGFLELEQGGSQSIDYVDVMDNHALEPGQWIAPGDADDYNSIDAGGNDRWFGIGSFDITAYKDFDDGNPMQVEVLKECTSGLPLNVSTGIEEGTPKTFITNSATTRETNCSVTETVPTGYTVSYATQIDGETNPDGCFYEDIEDNSELECYLTNHVIPVEVYVRKHWIDEVSGIGSVLHARAKYECFGEGELDYGRVFGSNILTFDGQDAIDSFTAIPHWNGETTCDVSERVRDPQVEADDSDCQGIPVLLGQFTDPEEDEFDCTIINTRIYAGIPTLSRPALAVLLGLVLGIGLIGFKRFA